MSLTFDYSCQSMLLEALGTSPSRPGPMTLSSLATVPKSDAMLTSLTWLLSPVLSVLWDNITGSNAVGWYLADSDLTLAPPFSPATLNGSLSLAPSSSSHVTVTIALSLSNTYSVTRLTQRVPITQLLANIVGLSGLLAVFGLSFGWFEAVCAKKVVGGRQPLSTTLNAPPAQTSQEKSMFFHDNPLAVQPPALQTRWVQVRDAEEIWFVAEDGSQTVWDLPAGGTVVREERED